MALEHDCSVQSQRVGNPQLHGCNQPTLCDLLLPHAILVVNKTVPFNAIAKPDKFITQLLKPIQCDQSLPPPERAAQFHELLLSLKSSQPSVVEVVPQLDPVTVQVLIVRCETYKNQQKRSVSWSSGQG